MKKKLTTAFLTLATALVFGQDARLDMPRLTLEPKQETAHSFGYLKMGMADAQLPTDNVKDALPGLGLGYRHIAGASAIDLSASYSRRDLNVEGAKVETYSYTLPKVSYLYYVTPASNYSVYVGAGVAAGGVKTQDNREFHGFIPSATIGLEMNRKASWRSFLQCEVSQPALAAIQTGSLPDTAAEINLGLGF